MRHATYSFLACVWLVVIVVWYRWTITILPNASLATLPLYPTHDDFSFPVWNSYNISQKIEFIEHNFNNWRLNDTSLTSSEFDPVSCRHPLWTPPPQITNNNMNISRTFVFVVTSMSSSHLTDVQRSLDMVRRITDIDICVIALDTASRASTMTTLKRITSVYPNVHIYILPNPVDTSRVPPPLGHTLRTKRNGHLLVQYLVLYTFALPYDKAIYLDTTMILLKPIDHLFACDMDFLYAGDTHIPCRQDMFVATSNQPQLLTHMLQTFYTISSTYTKQYCYESLGCGSCSYHTDPAITSRCSDTPSPFEFLYYFFHQRPAMARYFSRRTEPVLLPSGKVTMPFMPPPPLILDIHSVYLVVGGISVCMAPGVVWEGWSCVFLCLCHSCPSLCPL